MIFHAFKHSIAALASLTPNALLPKLGAWATNGKIDGYDWSEIYLLSRFLFGLALATCIPKSEIVVAIVIVIQTCSIVYLLKIIFPIDIRVLKDPSRSLFFAIGHYVEIGMCMGYIYWYLDAFNTKPITLAQSVYFSFVTMTTTGFGDITPSTDLARLVVTVHAVVSVFMIATVIGLFLSLSSAVADSKEQRNTEP